MATKKPSPSPSGTPDIGTLIRELGLGAGAGGGSRSGHGPVYYSLERPYTYTGLAGTAARRRDTDFHDYDSVLGDFGNWKPKKIDDFLGQAQNLRDRAAGRRYL